MEAESGFWSLPEETPICDVGRRRRGSPLVLCVLRGVTYRECSVWRWTPQEPVQIGGFEGLILIVCNGLFTYCLLELPELIG